jgi:hypothetical protein
MIITLKQRQTLVRKWLQGDLSAQGISYRQFRKTVEPTIGMDGAVTVKWCGLWLCIETDGYCHS